MKKRITVIIILTICLVINIFSKSYAVNEYMTSTSISSTSVPSVDETQKIYDYANLISTEEEKNLYNDIQKFIEKYNMDMVIVTINENPKYSSMEYADDFYDYNNFGIGTNKSGILFLIDMKYRKMWISTTGNAIKIYNDKRIDSILDYTYDKISNQDYYGCAEQFIEKAGYFANKGTSGSDKIVTKSQMIIKSTIFATIETLILICIGVFTHKKPSKKREASDYITTPIKIEQRSDLFINKYVSKERIQSSSSSGGGSSTHTGSSGTSHGGGGRSF